MMSSYIVFLKCLRIFPFQYGGTNFTVFRMVDLVRPDVQNILYAILRDQIETQAEVLPNVPQFLDTTTAIIYDSVHAFSLALHQLRSVQQVHQMNLDCSGPILKDLSFCQSLFLLQIKINV